MNKIAVTQSVQSASFLPFAQGILQRKCACGNHTIAGGECAECAKKTSGLRRKPTIGASNDPLEREADRVAEQVTAAPTHSVVSSSTPRIQRHTGQTSAQPEKAPASVERVLGSAGRPLDIALRKDMESRFGHDFSQVQVHLGAAAEQSAREVNANAYTVGQNIVFGAGRFAPNLHEGRRLIAHELTHVMQQTGGSRLSSEQTPACLLRIFTYKEINCLRSSRNPAMPVNRQRLPTNSSQQTPGEGKPGICNSVPKSLAAPRNLRLTSALVPVRTRANGTFI